MVSILGEDYYYDFPAKVALEKRLKDLLEVQVDEKYYLSDKMKDYIVSGNEKYKVSEKNLVVNRDIACSKTTRETQTRADCSDYICNNLPENFNLKRKLYDKFIKEPCLEQVAQIEGAYESTGRVYSPNGLAPTINTCGGGNREPKILQENYIDNPLKGKTKYGWHFEQNVYAKNSKCCRSLKASEGSGNIPKILENENLKRQLCNKLVQSGIMQENYVINHSYTNGLNGKNPNSRQTLEDYIETTNNIMPTLTTRPDVLGVVVNDMPKCLGGIGEKKSNGGTQYYQQDRIYSADSVAMCHTANLPSGSYMYAINEPTICASRGRNPDNPSSRVAGQYTEQRLEINKSGCSNTLTTVQKDNYVIEPKPMKYVEKKLLETIEKNGGKVPEVTVINNYRIRKLTPKECFRLMGVKDQDFERIAQNQSNASLYHLAGDSIVVDVLMAMFKEML